MEVKQKQAEQASDHEKEGQKMCCDGQKTAEQHRSESADGKCCSD